MTPAGDVIRGKRLHRRSTAPLSANAAAFWQGGLQEAACYILERQRQRLQRTEATHMHTLALHAALTLRRRLPQDIAWPIMQSIWPLMCFRDKADRRRKERKISRLLPWTSSKSVLTGVLPPWYWQMRCYGCQTPFLSRFEWTRDGLFDHVYCKPDCTCPNTVTPSVVIMTLSRTHKGKTKILVRTDAEYREHKRAKRISLNSH